ncbi:tRNA pseudouridine(38-40) synthase TruA [Clostridium beijerinckii]|uniref:tRNA pseudouridine synthase A n=1 Tax=Clostridium beijerinckii TaxID=1520 RepID=A0AAX0B7C7_CLOBE|nr:tRNA pseudouridine(38-40) synthase TruA [Clostridium beijerinckii]NRT90369.1 tRNA pseudouridine38-40 synthase [Clostridium beijerinckii]NYC69894.1 tRNA pseudouridine38-40 synthase [Clostridium beijerinckii]
MRNIKLIIEFDGSNFCGWQRQPKGRAVQKVIETAIFKATGEEIMINGSSRTDAGVHAREMVANFLTNSSIPGDKFREAINTRLPEDVSIIKSEEVSEDFHARYSSKGKTYSYTIVNRYERLSLGHQYLYHYKYKLDINEMRRACEYFIGRHDFRAFMSPGSSIKTTTRTIQDLYIEQNGDEIKIFITADGFLYNMVRIIVGTLIKIGNGKLEAENIKDIIEEGNRKKAGMCVPPNGLILEKVFY